MANPDIVDLATLNYERNGVAMTTATGTLVGEVATGEVEVIDCFFISNVDGTNDADATITHVQSGGSSIKILSTVTIKADTTERIDGPINLTEGDYMTGSASANGDLEFAAYKRKMSET